MRSHFANETLTWFLFWSWCHYSCLVVVKALSHAQTPPSSHEEKGSGVTSPNPWATSWSVEWPMILQSSVYWNDAEARASTSNTPPKVMLWNSLLITLTSRWDLGVRLKVSGLWHQTPSCMSWVGSGHGTSESWWKFLLRVNAFFSHSHYPCVSNNAWCASMKYEFVVNSDCHAMWFTPSLHLIYVT